MTYIKSRTARSFYSLRMKAQMSQKQTRRVFDLVAGGVVALILGLGLAQSDSGSQGGVGSRPANLEEPLVTHVTTNMAGLPQAN